MRRVKARHGTFLLLYPVLGRGRTAAAWGAFTLLGNARDRGRDSSGEVVPGRFSAALPAGKGFAAAGLRGGRGGFGAEGTPGPGSALGMGRRAGRLQQETSWKLPKQGPYCRGNPLSSRGLVRWGRKYSRCFEIDVSKQVFIVPACKKGLMY